MAQSLVWLEVGTTVNPLTGGQFQGCTVVKKARTCQNLMSRESEDFSGRPGCLVSCLSDRYPFTKASARLGRAVVPFGNHTIDACHGATWMPWNMLRKPKRA